MSTAGSFWSSGSSPRTESVFHQADVRSDDAPIEKRSQRAVVERVNSHDRLSFARRGCRASGCSAAWQRASFGTRRSQVQILPSRPDPRLGAADVVLETRSALIQDGRLPDGSS